LEEELDKEKVLEEQPENGNVHPGDYVESGRTISNAVGEKRAAGKEY
jgi:hypothetical protein